MHDKLHMAVTLGKDIIVDEIEMEADPVTVEDRLAYLEQAIKQHTLSLDSLYSIVKENNVNQIEEKHIDDQIEINKSDNKIPIGTRLIGTTKGTPFWCMVKEDGFYVGINRYDSLSAAAKMVSGVRRSGWSFWKFDTGQNKGKSVKEIYKGK